ncbi:MAG: FAD-dependent oxidoreductase [Tessaracoccus sp.]|nr:FAD-dependent oxidoreductase [Tessaracoccus sp.]
MQEVREQYDVVVCGGGLAGVSAAISAARHGAKVVLLHDRPVLGGNSSSEVRVTPHGAAAFHAYAREGGIIAEALIEDRARNHERITENGWTNSVWDLILYDMVQRTVGLTLRLNTPVTGAEVSDGRILSVTARNVNAETVYVVEGRVFIDCTGDGTLGEVAGCESRHGIESHAEFGEPSAPDEPSEATMGSSLHFKTVDVGHPVPFTPPPWAASYDDIHFFRSGGRVAKTLKSGYWWIEIGPPWHTIHGNEEIRHELTRQVLGIWDWYKNHDPEWSPQAETIALDWIGQVPGKRESRRLVGERFLTEHDLRENPAFEDEVAFGGWYIDLHSIGGLYEEVAEPLTNARMEEQGSNFGEQRYVGPFGIPLSALVSKDIENLMFAGRNISASHVALGALRVQGTTAVMGQATGTAAALALARGGFKDVLKETMPDIQQALVRDGCFLPHVPVSDALDLAPLATVESSSETLIAGVGPDDTFELNGLDHWRDYPIFPTTGVLDRRLSQWVAVGEGQPVSHVGFCLSNTGDTPVEIAASIRKVDGIWDYRVATEALRIGSLTLPPGVDQWIDWQVGLSSAELEGQGYIRLDLEGVSDTVEWRLAGAIAPGQVAGYEVAPGRLRRFGGGATLSFRVEPPQRGYPASHITNGVCRPHARTNQWRSAVDQGLPQWSQLVWDEPTTVAEVQITFPGHLLREYHACPPLYRDPQCAKNYTVSVRRDGHWVDVASANENYQTRVVHTFDPVACDALRVTIRETNGDTAAGIYEIRCYSEPTCTPCGL